MKTANLKKTTERFVENVYRDLGDGSIYMKRSHPFNKTEKRAAGKLDEAIVDSFAAGFSPVDLILRVMYMDTLLQEVEMNEGCKNCMRCFGED